MLRNYIDILAEIETQLNKVGFSEIANELDEQISIGGTGGEVYSISTFYLLRLRERKPVIAAVIAPQILELIAYGKSIGYTIQ